MANLVPASATILADATYEFTTTISNAVWRAENGGSFSSGSTALKKIYTPNSLGVKNIKAHSSLYDPNYLPASYTLDSNDVLTRLVDAISYTTVYSIAQLSQANDSVSFIVPSRFGQDYRIGVSPNFRAYYFEFYANQVIFPEGGQVLGFVESDKITIVRRADNKADIYINDNFVWTSTYVVGNSNPWRFYVIAVNTAAPIVLQPPVLSGAGILNYIEETAVITVVGALTADFSAPTSINLGDSLIAADTTTGGAGVRQLIWKIDGVTITAATNLTNPTFTGLSAGDHTLTLEVTDSTGVDTQTYPIFVGQLTGAGFVALSQTTNFSSNVPATAVWTVLSGLGSINASGQFTAPSSGSGSSVIKVANGAKFATKTVYYAQQLNVSFAPLSFYLQNQNFTINAIVTGGFSAYTYEWKIVETNTIVGNSANLTLNKPAGDFTLRLSVTDSIGLVDVFESNIHVVVNIPLSITTESLLTDRVVNVAFSKQLEFEGAVGGEVFELIDGALPTGVTISTLGLISGTATISGVFYFTAKLSNSNTSVTKNFILFVAPVSSAFALHLSRSVFRQGSQFADIEESHVAGEKLLTVVKVANASGAVSLSDNSASGTFTQVSGSTDLWIYNPRNETKQITITASSGASNDSKTLSVEATFPINCHLGYDFDTPTLAKVLTGKDNTPKFRTPPIKKSAIWTLPFLKRTIMDVSVLKTFEMFHDIDKEFWLIDPELMVSVKARLDSSIKVKENGANNFEMNCVVKVYKLASLSIPTSY